ncbi:flagellar basal body P-ring formation chaperone FlgA [Steroidobacter denitrificans]|nr:flagellar basal body P-ring formation chaperone FlgA [Steroidobacter denitrificans]
MLLMLMGSFIMSPVEGTAMASPGGAVQSLDEIRQAAADFVRTRLPADAARHHVEAARLDPRLQLQACAVPLETFAANAQLGARTTVGVRCARPAAWTLYVSVGVEAEMTVLVLRHALPRQAAIGPQDVEPQTRRLAGSAMTFVHELTALQGQRLKRAAPAGTVLTAELLTPDILVRRGQQVTLIAAGGSVEIRARGQALSEGGASDRVRVQNLSSRKIVEGVVQSDGIVRVDL